MPDDRPEPAARAKTEPAIRCRAYGFVATTSRHRIMVQGNHEHRFMNPAGFLYHIGCFVEAVGCLTMGPASHEYPWFPGTVWRYALCGGCGAHVERAKAALTSSMLNARSQALTDEVGIPAAAPLTSKFNEINWMVAANGAASTIDCSL